MDGDFSMTTHVKKLVRSCFHSLRQIRVIRDHSQKRPSKCPSAVSSALGLITATQSLLAYQGLLPTILTQFYMLRLV